jgi:hypothetical protein
MIKKIDLFMPAKEKYGVLHHFTTQLGLALERKGVQIRFLEAEYGNPRPFLEKIFSGQPSCTLSFNGLLPDASGRFFCDMIKIPHIACLIDSPIHFYSLSQSPLNIVGCIDKYDVDFYRNISFDNSFFFPQAADPDIKPNGARDRIYDVVIMASLIDYIHIRDSWREQFPPLVCQAMEDAAELVLSNPQMTCISAFVEVIDSYVKGPVIFDPSKVDFLTCLAEIEAYVKGRDRVEMVRAIKNAKVYVFGSCPKDCSWRKYVGDKSNVIIHNAIPFEQTLEIMKQSKLVLSSASRIKYGASDNVFYGLACGALPITERNEYLEKDFKNKESISFFETGQWDQIDENVQYYLTRPKELQEAAKAGYKKTMEFHTWDNRATLLIEKVTPILEKMGAKNAN